MPKLNETPIVDALPVGHQILGYDPSEPDIDKRLKRTPAEAFRGDPGPAGADGQDGAPGAPGEPGPAGPAGADGSDGADGGQGPVGPAGAPGAPGEDGADGATIRDGATNPSNALGVDGDYFIQTASGDLFHKESGTYVLKGNLRGPAGPAGSAGATGATGANGTDGNKIRSGTANPSNATGIDGDLFVNSTSGDLFQRQSGAYALLFNIKGVKGDTGTAGADGSTIRSGSGAPSNALGKNTDFYINVTNGDFYLKASNVYTLQGNLRGPAGADGAAGPTGGTGAAGADGSQIRSGTANPANSVGKDTDIFINTTTGDVLQRASGAYTVILNIKGATGAAGNTIRSGTGAPSNALGANGDFYINRTTYDLYEKASGAYSVIGNIKGANGADGATGATGATGTNGTNGTNGSIIRFGTAVPANTLGADGDYYLRTTTYDFYNKASGAYTIIGNLKGADGTGGSGGASLSTARVQGYLLAGLLASVFFSPYALADAFKTSTGVDAGNSSGVTYNSTAGEYNNDPSVDTTYTSYLKFDGANGTSSPITDEKGHTFAAVGTGGAFSTAQAKAGTASWIGTGAGGVRCLAANAVDFAYGTGNFTDEIWIRPTSSNGGIGYHFIDHRNADGDGFALYLLAGNVWYYNGIQGTRIQGAAITQNVWTHIAVVRNGTTVTVYVNGVASITATNQTANFPQNNFHVGCAYNGGEGMVGYVDEFKSYKGVAKYTGTFDPNAGASVTAIDLRSVTYNANAVPTKAGLGVLLKLTSGTITVNTNLIGYVSRNGGTTWTAVVLALAMTDARGYLYYEAPQVDISAQSSGQALKWRITTTNAINVAVDAVALDWS